VERTNRLFGKNLTDVDRIKMHRMEKGDIIGEMQKRKRPGIRSEN
jgi:hypothetical protein